MARGLAADLGQAGQAGYVFHLIHDHGIVCRDADGRELTLDADTVILAAGMAPLRAEALALEPVSSEFRMVGDCKRPRQILEAVREGYDAAMEV